MPRYSFMIERMIITSGEITVNAADEVIAAKKALELLGEGTERAAWRDYASDEFFRIADWEETL